MFLNKIPSEALIYSFIILVPLLIVSIIAHIRLNRFCKTHTDNATPKESKKAAIGRLITLVLFSVSGLLIGNILNIVIQFNIALSHGMTVNPDTNEYDIVCGEMIALNKKSIKETNIDASDLKGKAVIYVRYDCPDCVILHDQLSEINDMIFLSSRSETGKKAREMYDIALTDIPQGVYIDENGNATTIVITERENDTIKLDLQQIAILREMANRHNGRSA